MVVGVRIVMRVQKDGIHSIRVLRCALAGAVVVSCVATVGCSPKRAEQPLPQLKYGRVVAVNAIKGVELAFNHPVSQITWEQGKTVHHTALKKPSTDVWVPAALAQGTTYQILVKQATGPESKPLRKAVTLQGETAAPLTVTTNPGVWQFNVPAQGPFTFTFSAPVANPSQLTQDIHFTPNVQGKVEWTSPTTAEFIPDKPLPPTETVQMTLAGGPQGPVSKTGQYLQDTSIERPFIVASDEQVVVRETSPETLTLYKNGKQIFKSLCNTGVTGAATAPGQYYIHAKELSATMSGTDPDGETYHIKGVPYVMDLVGNTAIHGYPRKTYGYPQSNGCVELPIKAAKKLYQLVKIGTPVVIQK
ncbi:hypothetical protein N007_17670 [Alicyclobacillus acidoterrestris ATCC 49025]|nr:hypothetical protein N007_17670 [Alicyclobacillus acidoterrestris ATCC 49025]